MDEQLLAAIAAITAEYARRRGADPALNREGDRKQALVPHGATVIPPAGTAPGLLLAFGSGHLLVLPGPPRELAAVWTSALETGPMTALVARAGTLLRHTLRVYGAGEPAVAQAFAAAGGDAGGTRTTICARLLEVEVTVRAEPERQAALARLVAGLREQLGDAVFAEDERPLSEHVLEILRERGLRLAVAESCTAGLVGARLADIPGSSDVLLGGVIAYANDGQAGAARRSGGADRRVRSRLGGVRPGDGRGARVRRRGPMSASPSPGSRDRAAAPRASPWVSSTCTSPRPAASAARSFACPAAARRCARSRRSPPCTSCARRWLRRDALATSRALAAYPAR